MAGIDLSNEAALTDAQRSALHRIYGMPDAKLAFDLDAIGGITYLATKQTDGSVACVWQIGKNILITPQQKSNIFAVMQAFNTLRFGNEIAEGSVVSNPQDGSYRFTATGEAGDYFVDQAQTDLKRKNETMDFDGYQAVFKQDQTRGHWVAYIDEVPTISAIGSDPAHALDQLREAFSMAREHTQPDGKGWTWPEPAASASRPAPQAALDSCAMGACFQFGVEKRLERATGLTWSVAPEGGAYIASGDRILLEALATQMRPHLHPSAGDREEAITVSGQSTGPGTLRITRGACETGGFVQKFAEAFRSTNKNTCFMGGLCIEQLHKLTPYEFKLATDHQHPDKPACAKAILNADSARGLQEALSIHGGIQADVRPIAAPEGTPQRDLKAELFIQGDRMTLEKLRALGTNHEFKTAFDYEAINHVAAATSAFRSGR